MGQDTSDSSTGSPGSVATDTRLRLRLRVGVKLLVAIAFLASVWVLLSGIRSPGPDVAQVPTEALSLQAIAENATLTHLWYGRPVIVVRRSDALQRWLAEDPLRDLLRDPDSRGALQPDWVDSSWRGRDARWFVAIASGTDLGCPVRWLAPGNAPAGWPLAGRDDRWPGGFIDSCGQSLYDPAGRVYRGQAAERNLAVPDYRIDATTLLLGAE